MQNAVIGYPRIGVLRELKFAIEKYFKGEINKTKLIEISYTIKEKQWKEQRLAGVNYISCHDFSLYDGMLDTTVMLNATPTSYKALELDTLDTYFAMARGYQGSHGDVKAFAMKKWFNTNYHYMVPELYDDTEIKLQNHNFLSEYQQAKAIGIRTKPVIIGAVTFLKLASYLGTKQLEDYVEAIIEVYSDILKSCDEEGVQWVQIDEPILVTDLKTEDVALFKRIYKAVLKNKGNVKVLLQTYFGDIRECYEEAIELPFDGIGLDMIEGKKTEALLESCGFPKNKQLFAGLINGKNIWKYNAKKKLAQLNRLKKYTDNIVISTSCSLLHVPYTLGNEVILETAVTQYFSFAEEKLGELSELCLLAESNDHENEKVYKTNQQVFSADDRYTNKQVQKAVNQLSERDFVRKTPRAERQERQKKVLQLPILPTTTIGSFPQTLEVKQNRAKYRKGEITKIEYDEKIKAFIKDCIADQEALDLDVLVHGEYERNDMVEFFGESLEGYIFTEKAWVQSYGTRCVKPPIIFSDISRSKAMTVFYSKYANSLTKKEVKGMLTGPVTILNWSFPREDISLREMAYQIALAIREEVLDLEKAGIRIIQIDEAALKEKLPIRREAWHSDYLDWAIKAFRLCHSRVKPETQIHTHMCYSEFEEIIKDIDEMDADVITFEASRSKLTIIDALEVNDFETEVGPGVYDIHSPRVPSISELEAVIKSLLERTPQHKLWINPDCGLKTRGIEETHASLSNMVQATKNIRKTLG